MLTPERLDERLQQWSVKLRETVAPPSPAHPSPIALYQSLFALVHDLKGSVQLTQTSTAHPLLDTVLATDQILHELAYDELELTARANLSLHRLVSNLSSLESLQMFLEKEVLSATPPSPRALALLSEPYPWEGLARARALSAARHGYVFFSCRERLSLTDLPSYDRHLGQNIGSAFGIQIVRKIEAETATNATAGAQLNLNVLTVAAFPHAVTEATLRAGTPCWTLVKDPSRF